MKFESVATKIHTSLKSGETLSPFLFLWSNLEILHSEIAIFTTDLLQQYNIPTTSIIKIEDDGENLKIEAIRSLLRSASVRANFDFQIFVIENISRLTLASSNSLLKFLEEPGEGNIIFLSNASESGILETILSRVVPVYENNTQKIGSNSFFVELLSNANTPSWKQTLLSYIYSSKLEKSEYIDFLQTILKSSSVTANQMQELSEDILAVSNNNVLPKYVLDKWVMEII